MASPGNQHCASCIGTLSFPIAYTPTLLPSMECTDLAAAARDSRLSLVHLKNHVYKRSGCAVTDEPNIYLYPSDRSTVSAYSDLI